jgi:hypothetical protein
MTFSSSSLFQRNNRLFRVLRDLKIKQYPANQR